RRPRHATDGRAWERDTIDRRVTNANPSEVSVMRAGFYLIPLFVSGVACSNRDRPAATSDSGPAVANATPAVDDPVVGKDDPYHKTTHSLFADGPDDVVLKTVMKWQTGIENKDEYDCTPLHYAARYGRYDAAKWLIEHKADVNTRSYNQFTPMHVVA